MPQCRTIAAIFGSNIRFPVPLNYRRMRSAVPPATEKYP
jgi:hypothetical protein